VALSQILVALVATVVGLMTLKILRFAEELGDSRSPTERAYFECDDAVS
jgi:hypothetical protein